MHFFCQILKIGSVVMQIFHEPQNNDYNYMCYFVIEDTTATALLSAKKSNFLHVISSVEF